MNWINDLLWGEGIGHSILLLSFVIAAGIQLGKIKVFGVSLGITLVLFVGIPTFFDTNGLEICFPKFQIGRAHV